jgi:hypothetical protein
MREKAPGMARILGGNKIDLRENLAGTLGNIAEIADGCCHHV